MPYSFTRLEIYNLIWSEPIQRIAPRIGISGPGLAKVCRRHGIPLPPRGYWAKLAAHKTTARPELPKRGLGMPNEISNKDRIWHRVEDPEDPESIQIPPAPEFDEAMSDVADRVKQMVGKVTAPKSLDHAHVLVARVLAEDEQRREKQRASRYPSIWDAPLFDSPYEKRRLRIFNGIFNSLTRCEMKPWLSGKESLEAGVRVGECMVSFRLDDPTLAPDRYRPRTPENRPASDKLELKVMFPSLADGFQRSWKDDAKTSLESHLSEIVVSLIVVGESAYRHHEIQRHEWLVQRKERLIEEKRERLEEARRREQERLEKVQKARVDRLLREAALLRQANDIREYVDAVRRGAGASTTPPLSPEVEGWAAWSLSVANSIDPVRSRRYLVQEDGIDALGKSERD